MRLAILGFYILVALSVVATPTPAEAARKLPPRGGNSYCCAAFLEPRPPRWWNGKIVNRPLPAWCRRTCGRTR
jgi:hypothetical protein